MKIRNLKHMSTKARSKASEKRAASFMGGKVQPASGALPVAAFKGDVVTDDYMVDDKITGAQSFGVTVALWRKNNNDARRIGKAPMLRIVFTDGPTLYVMDEITFANLHKCQSQSPDKPTKFPMGRRTFPK